MTFIINNLAEKLRRAPMATLLMEPNSSEAKEFEDLLVSKTLETEKIVRPRARARTTKALQSLRRTISAFAADLILHSGHAQSLGYCYRSLERSAFSETAAESRQFDVVIVVWEKLGLIETIKGFQGADDFDGDTIRTRGWASRYRATKKLLQLAAAHSISPLTIRAHYRAISKLDFPIELRAKKKATTVYPGIRIKLDKTNPEVQRLASEVREINSFLESFSFNLETQPRFRRIFNNGDQPDFDWNQGGRLYAYGSNNFQQEKSDIRKLITIDGEETTELDVRSSQLTIAYGLAGESLPTGDPYEIEGVPRDVIKALVTAIIGKGNIPSRWPSEFAKDYLQSTGRKIGKDFKLGETVDLVLKKHPLLGRLSALGIDVYRLQYVESQILLRAILRLLRESQVPSLPIHDCLIIKAKDLELARQALVEEFHEEVGIVPTITIK